jgi:hypothetical protein
VELALKRKIDPRAFVDMIDRYNKFCDTGKDLDFGKSSQYPGASIAVHTYGDFLNFNPHLHAIVPDGCFLEGGGFRMAPRLTAQDL